MSRTALVGAFGVGSQTAKGTAATTLHYLPATSIGLNPNQNTQALPPEVGGSYFLRGAYKGGVSVAGDVAVLMRPDGVGNLLYGFAGTDTVTPVVGQTGAFSHVFSPFAPSTTAELPWLTLVKDTAKLYAEQYVDAKVSNLRMDFTKQSIANCSAGFFGITPTEITIASLGTETFDSGPTFTTCEATVSLTNEVGDTVISPNSIVPERITLDFQNRLSEDEYAVGSFFPIDVTLLQRMVNINYEIVIRDPALIRAVYRNGGTSTWSPTIFRGHLHIDLNTNAVVPTTTEQYKLSIDLPGIDFLAMPVSLNGASLIRASLSAQVSLGTSGADTFSMTLINGVASY